MTVREIGCCGAYCRTCMAAGTGGPCRGCKLGYDTGERDINKSRCKIKNCCFRDGKLETCADCTDYATCELIQDWYVKKGYKYKKYRQSIEFIRKNGYEEFFKRADKWSGPYGKLD